MSAEAPSPAPGRGRAAAPAVRVVCFSRGDALPLDGTVVAIDVIRASTTAVTAVASGRRCLPVASVEAAWALARRLPGALLAGEQAGLKPARFDLDNSPAEVAARRDVERPLVLLSSSGTRLMAAARPAPERWLACFRNWRATATRLAAAGRPVVLAGAGTRGEFREEDEMCCAWIAEALLAAGWVGDAATLAAVRRWSRAAPQAFLGSRSVTYLRRSGQLSDLEFILTHFDDLDAVYRLEEDEAVASEAVRAESVA